MLSPLCVVCVSFPSLSPQVVIVTPRQLEALIRMSEGLARMRLQPEVLPHHVEEAYQVIT